MTTHDDFISLVLYGPPRTIQEVETALNRPLTPFEIAKLNFHNTFCNVVNVMKSEIGQHPGITNRRCWQFWKVK